MSRCEHEAAAAAKQTASTDALAARRVELKYQVSHELAEQIRGWAREHLVADEHADPQLDDAYQVSTLYLDTADWDIYHRRDQVVEGKHRIRRYGNEFQLWLERKRKTKDVVRKQRTSVAADDLAELVDLTAKQPSDNSLWPESVWPGQWFKSRVQELQLRPATVIRYTRFARVGQSSRGPVRLTLDDAITAEPPTGWQIPASAATVQSELLPDAQILELKFSDHLPPQFKQLLIDFPISVSGFSKYRTAIDGQ